MLAIHSPFRYPGGKYYARSQILKLIPEAYTSYIEPFAGGASIFFAKEKSTPTLLNDKDPELINCYVQIRDDVESLIELLSQVKEPPNKELHSYYKNCYIPQNRQEQAFRWFLLNRISYSGIMKPNNCYWGYGDRYSMKPERWPELLRKCSEKLQNVELGCHDFEAVITQAPKGAFLFIDPPYWGGGQRRFYNPTFDKADHLRLFETLKRKNKDIVFLLTYDDALELKKYYQGWDCSPMISINEVSWNYTLNRTDDQLNGTSQRGKRSHGRELFIYNYVPPTL